MHRSDTTYDMTTIVRNVKRDLLFHIILHMRHYKITMEDAQSLAKEFLETLPVSTIEGLLLSLHTLAKTYEQARIVYIKYALPYYEEQKRYILTSVPPLIQRGDIEKAIALLKGGTNHG